MSKSTPGPWTIYRGEESAIAVVTYAQQPKDRRVVARVDAPSTKWEPQVVDANAHLIAAAPEMLDALHLIAKGDHSHRGCDPCSNWCPVQLAKEAIAKAEGREP